VGFPFFFACPSVGWLVGCRFFFGFIRERCGSFPIGSQERVTVFLRFLFYAPVHGVFHRFHVTDEVLGQNQSLL
jgi:hypothetical protein